MFQKLVSCSIALTLVALAYGGEHEDVLDVQFDYYPGVGYYYFGTGLNWLDAQTYCMSATKARLAVINSEEERQTIVSFLSKYTTDHYVYGGFTNMYDTQYVTTEGMAIKRSGYTKWETGKPSDSYNRCGGINTKTGELTDLSCDDAMSYICEHQLWFEYTYVEGIGYYKLHDEGKSWTDAYDICESEGAHLLVIDSQAEADAVMQIYNEHPHFPNAYFDDFVYIGIRAVIQLFPQPNDITILTIFGTSVSDLGYVKWFSNQTDVGDTISCGNLFRYDASYVMYACYFEFAFFCEKELQDFKNPLW